ncbi:FtsX-like permease family protein [Prolixibacteraceae bacterium Z1-6]|uniref:FtsX-like permease family protein n=1 Tax=Draconibacterium aestuarii TaxID=2998507 RepID=A0A9X3F315_9BACT|nr:FtsX-like permease family protein [Prolixibacteraceae bacterium Z1-6]
MNPLKLVLKELFYRKVSSLIIFVTVIAASTVFVAIYTLSKASENETRKIMREQGLNLYIFPKGTNLIDFYAVNNTPTFPENYIDTLSESKTFDAVRHLTGILQLKYPNWIDPNGSRHQIVVMGYKDEAIQRYLRKQELMGFDVPQGKVHIGALLSMNIPEGEKFKITGNDGEQYEFEIAQRLEEGKGMLDQGVAFHLDDLQKLLNMEGKINKIEALGCVCHDGRIKNARQQVQGIFPDLEVTEVSSIANARENQRQMMNKYGSFIIPFILIVAMLISALLFYSNVNSRKNEIGIMKAMGKSKLFIVLIILLKAFIIGLLGSFIGFFAGSFIAEYFGKEIFSFTAASIKPLWWLLGSSLVIFPVLWMISSWIPALLATRIDAAKTLSQE